jgi:hypothetical protein
MPPPKSGLYDVGPLIVKVMGRPLMTPSVRTEQIIRVRIVIRYREHG